MLERGLRLWPLGLAWLGLALNGAAPAQAQSARAGRFGLVHVDLMDLHVARVPGGPPVTRAELGADQIAERYRLAAAAGVGWNRWTLYREFVETADPYDWSVPDAIVRRDQAHGLRTLLMLQSQPESLDAPVFLTAAGGLTDDPSAASAVNPEHVLARFVSAAASRYRPGSPHGQVGAWEIGNEPNIHPYWRDKPEDYARFLEVAYLAIRQVDPATPIVHGGLADDLGAEAWYARMLASLRARGAASPLPARYGYYFDKSNWHWYRAPAHLQTGPGRARAILAEQGMPAKAIWVTETGIPVWNEYPGPCWDPASAGRATAAEQAGFVWQVAAEALASGVELLAFFQLYDDCGNGPRSYDAFGLVRNPMGQGCWEAPGDHGCWSADPALAGRPRPAHGALAVATRLLGGARFVRQSPAAGRGYRQVVFQSGGQLITFLWSTGGAVTARVPAASGAATVHRIAPDGGLTESARPSQGGQHVVALDAVSNHNGMGGRPMMAGMPVILVEGAGSAAGAAAVAPAPGAAPADPGGHAGPAAAPGMPAAAVVAADRSPPVLAMVQALPESVGTDFELSVVAGDEGAGLAAWLVHVAEGERAPTDPEAWRPIEPPRRWTAAPAAGVERLKFRGQPGRRYHFAAQAMDWAGNWTDLPPYAQASTRVGGVAPTGAAPAPAPAARRSGRGRPPVPFD